MNICPNCGCNPQEKPYYMVATHCPRCGYIFASGDSGADIPRERKQELLNNMISYLENYNDIDFEKIGVIDNIEDAELNESYNNCLGYIVELVGNDGNQYFFESVLGFTKNELIHEGMEWVYD